MNEEQRIRIRSENQRRRRVREHLDRRARERGFESEAHRRRERNRLLGSIEDALSPRLKREVLPSGRRPMSEEEKERYLGLAVAVIALLLVVFAITMLPEKHATHHHATPTLHSEGMR